MSNTATTTTNLVISFSGALSRLSRGSLPAADLDGALFYLGCTRAHAIDLHGGADFSFYAESYGYDAVEAAYQTLQTAILASEAAGRVAWRDLSGHNSWEQLNELLQANGLPQLQLDSDMRMINGGEQFLTHYSYPVLVETVALDQLPYNVIGYR